MLAPHVQHPPPRRVPHWAVVALAVGACGFIAAAIAQDHVFGPANLALGLPAFGLALAAAVASHLRREGAPALWLAGLGLAAAALVLGWFLLVAVVVAATCAVIVILHAVM
jgi:hypothetical protein